METIKQFIFNKYMLWIFLAIPITMMTIGIIKGDAEYEMIMHATGEFSTRLLILSLIATPLVMLSPKARFPKWLMRNRRYLGVAAFAYALLHTIYYLYETAFD